MQARQQALRSIPAVIGVLAGGTAVSLGLWAAHAPSANVLVPASIAVVLALALVPSRHLDRALAVSVAATLPLIPSVGLPNLPLGAAALAVALVRLGRNHSEGHDLRPFALIAALWLPLAIGALMSNWSSPSIWMRSVVILGFAVIACVVGVMVVSRRDRLDAWLDGFAIVLLVTSASALAVFALQYAFGPRPVADGLVGLLAYVRGDRSVELFGRINNWLIFGDREVLRAVSPFVPSPNNLGGIIGVLTPLTAIRWLTAREVIWRRVAGIAVALSLAALILTYSRSTWLAAIIATTVAMGFVAVFAHHVGRSWLSPVRLRDAALVLGLGACIGFAGIVSAGSAAAVDRVGQAFVDPSVTTRIETDTQAAEQFRTGLFRGVGLGNWGAFVGDESGVSYVHNVYLEYGVATGLFGFAWAVLLVIAVLLAGLLSGVRARNHRELLLASSFVGVGVFAAVQFFFDDNLLNPQYAWLLLWVIGASVAYATQRRQAE